MFFGAETLDGFIKLDQTRANQDQRPHPSRAQLSQHLAVDVEEHQIEENDVVIVELPDLQAILTDRGRIVKQVLFRQRRLNIVGEKYFSSDNNRAHGESPIRRAHLWLRGFSTNQQYCECQKLVKKC